MVVTQYNRYDRLGSFKITYTFSYCPSWREIVITDTVNNLVDALEPDCEEMREVLTKRLNIYVDEEPMLLHNTNMLEEKGMYFKEGYVNRKEGLYGELRK